MSFSSAVAFKPYCLPAFEFGGVARRGTEFNILENFMEL
jgi:hypothetical protein